MSPVNSITLWMIGFTESGLTVVPLDSDVPEDLSSPSASPSVSSTICFATSTMDPSRGNKKAEQHDRRASGGWADSSSLSDMVLCNSMYMEVTDRADGND